MTISDEARRAAADLLRKRGKNELADAVQAGECDWTDGVQAFAAFEAQIVERCAKIVEDNQETTTNTVEGTRHHLTPRKQGNIAGLAYAAAIRGAHNVKD